MQFRMPLAATALVLSLLAPSMPTPTDGETSPPVDDQGVTQTAPAVESGSAEEPPQQDASSSADGSEDSKETVSESPTPTQSEPETPPANADTPTPSSKKPSQAVSTPEAPQLLANSDPTVSEIQVGDVKMLVRRLSTGSGHGTSAQCAVNSQNKALFPDGNSAGEPADDSAEDEYTCWKDTVQYQIEFNLGPSGVDTEQKIKFSFDATDQGLPGTSREYRPYVLNKQVNEICTSSTDGLYVAENRRNLTRGFECEYTFKPGLSGSFKLPVITLSAADNTYANPYIRPKMNVNGQALSVPPTTIVTIPQIDLVTRAEGGPQITVIDGVPGISLGFRHLLPAVPFEPSAWHPTKGNPYSWVTKEYNYMIGFYQGGDIDSPQPLPEGAKVIRHSNDPVYVDPAGKPIETVSAPPGSDARGIWLPMDVYNDLQGIGVWGRIVPLNISVPNGAFNFNKEEAWDPGSDEKCSFSTASLRLTNVRDGVTTPNNNCYVKNYKFGEYTFGLSSKRLNGSNQVTTSPDSKVRVELQRAEAPTANDSYALCDVWDSPQQESQKRSAGQTIVPHSADYPHKVTVRFANKIHPLPDDIWRAEYAYSPISVAGGFTPRDGLLALKDAVQQRCEATEGWSTDPEQIGVDKINAVRFVVDQSKLEAFMKAQGHAGFKAFIPTTDVSFYTKAPGIDQVPADGTYTTATDHMANVDFPSTDGPTGTFVVSRNMHVSRPASTITLNKYVSTGGTFLKTGTEVAGGKVRYQLDPNMTVNYRDSNTPNSYTLTLEDELPACADGEPFEFDTRPLSNLGMDYTFSDPVYTAPQGDPCYESGPEHKPGKITWTVQVEGKDPKAVRHYLSWRTFYSVNLMKPIELGKTLPTTATLKLKANGKTEDDPIARSLDKQTSDKVSVSIIPGAAETVSTKTVQDKLVRTGEDITWNVTLSNTGSGEAGSGDWIDVLPHNGDEREGQKSSAKLSYADRDGALSNVRFGDVVWSSTDERLPAPADAQVRLAVTTVDPSSIHEDPRHASNQEGGDTPWCWVDTADDQCAEALNNATALRFVTEKMPAYSQVKIPFTASTQHMRDGSTLWNNLGLGRVEGLTLEVPASKPVRTNVYDLLIDGTVWYDSNKNAKLDDDEERLEGVTVELVDKDEKVVRTAKTDGQGYYYFGQGISDDGDHPGLNSDQQFYVEDGTYTVRVVREDGVILDEWEYTLSGKNDALDGTSEDLVLGRTSDDETEFPKYRKADFGLYTDTHLVWKKVDQDDAPLSGATFEVTADGIDPITVTDNGEGDLDPADGVIKIQVRAAGEYTVRETVAPEGYDGTDDKLTGTVKTGAPVTELGTLVNTVIPPETPPATEPPSPSESTSQPPTDPSNPSDSESATESPSESVPVDSQSPTASSSAAPSESVSTPAASQSPEAGASEPMARTGAAVLVPIVLAALLLISGALLMLARRRSANS